MNLTIRDVLEATKGTLIQGDQSTSIDKLSIDTRTICPDDFYLPLKGENFNGHQFIREAVEKGAAGVFKEKSWGSLEIQTIINKFPRLAIIEVDNTLKALQNLGRYKVDQSNPKVIGITGSVGKTTTKDMISQVLEEDFSILKTKGNFNNEVGLPLTLLNLQQEHQIAVLEMGMSNFEEIQTLVKMAPPNIAVITNIGSAHIQNLKSKENILKAKMEIAGDLKAGDILLLNGDDPLLWELRNIKAPYRKVYYGIHKHNDVYPLGIAQQESGSVFKVHIGGKEREFHIGLQGKHQVANAIAALWIGYYYNMEYPELRRGLEKIQVSDMRFEAHEIGKTKIINDAYNASPESMKASIEVIENTECNRRILVLGDILELGDYSEQGHRKVGSFISKGNYHRLITKGKDAKWIGLEAVKQGFPAEKVEHVKTNEEAAKLLVRWMEPMDLVLIKGSRGMRMEEIIEILEKGSQQNA